MRSTAGLKPTSVSTNRLTSGVYDVGGNLTSWNGAAYGYDRLNMPTQICSSGTLAACSGENWLFAYTADDERILEYRIGGGAFRTSLRDLSGKILREYRVEAASNWSSFEDFIYRDSTLLASVHPTEGTRFFGPDHLGTPRAVFNSAGSVIALHTYYPFGEEATANTQDTQQMKFTGHERDLLSTPTGVADDTDYMHARQFSIQTARFHSFDPVGGNLRRPQSWNRYAYVLGNPMKYTDPTGLETKGDPAVNPCDWPVQRECVDPDPGHWHMDPDAPRWGGGGGGNDGMRGDAYRGFRGSGYMLGELIPRAANGDEWAQMWLGYDNIGALGDPAFDPIEIGVTFAAGMLSASVEATGLEVKNVTIIADKDYAKNLFRVGAGDASLVAMRDRSTGFLVGVRDSSETAFYRPKGSGMTNVEIVVGKFRLNIHVRHGGRQ